MPGMSSAARWSYTATATLWPLTGRDSWSGVPTYGTPEAVACDYQAESRRMTDPLGVEFTSRGLFYTERADIKQGDRIAVGTSSVVDPVAAGAIEVRSVTRYGDTLERQADDYLVAT